MLRVAVVVFVPYLVQGTLPVPSFPGERSGALSWYSNWDALPAWSFLVCKMGVILLASWCCGEHQRRWFKGSGDFTELCKGGVSSA